MGERLYYSLPAKLKKLKSILKSYPGVVLAFSGGVDSSFLLKAARKVLGDRVLAVTAASPLYPESETARARQIAKKIGVRHIIIKSREMLLPQFLKNPRNRCYYCKYELFTTLKKIAAQRGYAVIDGSNRSDRADYRPGSAAGKKLGISSPLAQAGLKKDEIRRLARQIGLPNWNKPALACLASRIPYGRMVDRKTLRRIGRAEDYLQRMGSTQVRVRDHFPVARIEVPPNEFTLILRRRGPIVKYLKKLGYKHISLDLIGYQTGSMNL